MKPNKSKVFVGFRSSNATEGVGKPDDTCYKSGIARPTQYLPNAVAPQPTPKFMKVCKNQGWGFLSSESD
ncbi:hypothetical protein LC593_04875 [Nostoc sp. CHAB 5844]|nr:hypothetical protein [Nostoc sp. CHAB 5844]